MATLTFTPCTVPVEAGQTQALQLSSILPWGSTPGICRALQRLALGDGWGTEGDRLSCACTLWGFEVQSMFGCSCMTNLRPVHPYQFCITEYISDGKCYLRWSQRSPLYPDKHVHLPSPVIPLLHAPWMQSQTVGKHGFALLSNSGVWKHIVSGCS